MMRVFVIIVELLFLPLIPSVPNQQFRLHLLLNKPTLLAMPTIQRRSSESRLHSSHLIVLPGVQYKMNPLPGSVNLIVKYAGVGAGVAKVHPEKESMLHNSTFLYQSQSIDLTHLYANCVSKCGNRKNLPCRVRRRLLEKEKKMVLMIYRPGRW